MSMIANLVSGKSGATVFSTSPKAKPVITTGLAPASARRRSACSRWASDCISSSLNVPPVSLAQRCAPLKAASLKDLSNLPPRSKMMAGSASAAPEVSASVAAAPRNFVRRVMSSSRFRFCVTPVRGGPAKGGPISCGSGSISAALSGPVNWILRAGASLFTFWSRNWQRPRPASVTGPAHPRSGPRRH